jgi:hypothetical protein
MRWKEIIYACRVIHLFRKDISARDHLMNVRAREQFVRNLEILAGNDGRPAAHAATRQLEYLSRDTSKTPLRFGPSKGRNLC